MLTIVKILIIILALLGLSTLIIKIYKYFYFRKEIDKRSDGKRYCMHCKFGFTHPYLDHYKYCPVCGRELTFFNINEVQSDEDRREN